MSNHYSLTVVRRRIWNQCSDDFCFWAPSFTPCQILLIVPSSCISHSKSAKDPFHYISCHFKSSQVPAPSRRPQVGHLQSHEPYFIILSHLSFVVKSPYASGEYSMNCHIAREIKMVANKIANRLLNSFSLDLALNDSRKSGTPS